MEDTVQNTLTSITQGIITIKITNRTETTLTMNTAVKHIMMDSITTSTTITSTDATTILRAAALPTTLPTEALSLFFVDVLSAFADL